MERRRNICLGVNILRHYYDIHGDWDTALRAYNGALRSPIAGQRYVEDVQRELDRL